MRTKFEGCLGDEIQSGLQLGVTLFKKTEFGIDDCNFIIGHMKKILQV